MSTEQFPTDERWYQIGPDPLVALRVYGTPTTVPLLFDNPFVMGTAKLCDVCIKRRYLAKQQVRFRWTGAPHSKLQAENLSAKNDVVLNGELAQRELTFGAGDWFSVGDSRYFVLTEEMRLVFPRLLEFFGSTSYELVDKLMIAAIRNAGQHFLLIGEAGCAQEEIARLIHRISRRRHNDFKRIDQDASFNAATNQAVRSCVGGTAFVDVHEKGRVTPRLAEALTRENAGVRLIVSAPTTGKFAGSFPGLIHNVREINIPSIRERKDDVPGLIDKWATQERSSLRFARLRGPLRRAISKVDWSGNYDELFAFGAVLRLLAPVREQHTPRQVERDSTVLRSTRESWEKRLGLKIEIPLMPNGDRDHGGRESGGELAAAKKQAPLPAPKTNGSRSRFVVSTQLR